MAESEEEGDGNVDWNWEEVADSVFDGEDKRPIILFDGVCNLCNGGVNYALDHDEEGNFRFVSLQSKIGQSLLLRHGKESDDLSSIVLVKEDQAFFKSDAVLRIAQKLNSPLPYLGYGGMIFPGFVRNVIYNFVSENRYRFGQLEDSCRLWDDNFDDRFLPDEKYVSSEPSEKEE